MIEQLIQLARLTLAAGKSLMDEPQLAALDAETYDLIAMAAR